jgi:hypothetical protein
VSAAEVLRVARAAGVDLRVDGEALVLEAGAPPPPDMIDLLSRNKPALVALLRARMDGWLAEEWYAFFDERAAIAEFDGGLPRRKAEAVAFRSWVVEWLNRNPVCSPPECCCWCGGGERADNVLLPIGVDRAGHAWLHSACWRPWHEHRQAQAADFLRAFGFAAPSESPNDFAKNGAA